MLNKMSSKFSFQNTHFWTTKYSHSKLSAPSYHLEQIQSNEGFINIINILLSSFAIIQFKNWLGWAAISNNGASTSYIDRLQQKPTLPYLMITHASWFNRAVFLNLFGFKSRYRDASRRLRNTVIEDLSDPRFTTCSKKVLSFPWYQ